MLQLGPMDLRTHVAASTRKQTQLSVGTMRASQLDQSSTVQPNLHAKLLRNLLQPMRSARRPTRGWILHWFFIAGLTFGGGHTRSNMTITLFMAAGPKRLHTTERRQMMLS